MGPLPPRARIEVEMKDWKERVTSNRKLAAINASAGSRPATPFGRGPGGEQAPSALASQKFLLQAPAHRYRRPLGSRPPRLLASSPPRTGKVGKTTRMVQKLCWGLGEERQKRQLAVGCGTGPPERSWLHPGAVGKGRELGKKEKKNPRACQKKSFPPASFISG